MPSTPRQQVARRTLDVGQIAGATQSEFSINEEVIDLNPDNTDRKVFKPGTAAAANAVCLSCKTQDHIMRT